MPAIDLGEFLVRRKLITREQLAHGLDVHRKMGGSLLAVLGELGYIVEERVVASIADSMGVGHATAGMLEGVRLDVVYHLTRDLAERYRAVPLRVEGLELHVCVADPERLDELDDLSRAIGRPVRAVLVTEAALTDALDRFYAIRPELRFTRQTEKVTPTQQQLQAVERAVDKTGIIKVPTGLSSVVPEPGPAPAGSVPDVATQLAAANTARDLVWPVFTFTAGLFSEVAVLGFHKGHAQVLLAGNRLGPRALPKAVDVPLRREGLIWSVLARPQICHRAMLNDADLAAVCRATGLAPYQICLIPIFDSGRPVFLIVGQGCDEHQVRGHFEALKAFVTKVGKAIRIVALKAELRAS